MVKQCGGTQTVVCDTAQAPLSLDLQASAPAAGFSEDCYHLSGGKSPQKKIHKELKHAETQL